MKILAVENGQTVAKDSTDSIVKGQIKQDLGLDKVENKTDAERVQSGAIKQALDAKVSIGANSKAFLVIGTLNPSSNQATKNDGSSMTVSPTPDTNLLDGDTLRILNSGTLNFSGRNFTSGQAVNVGDELTKFGNQWAVTLYAQNTAKIASWIAQAYSAGSQVNYNGEDWYCEVNTTSADVPSLSSNWKPRLSKMRPNSQLGKNLFDKSTMVQLDKGVGADGVVYGSTGMGSAVNVPVSENTTYTISGLINPHGIGFYNASKVKLSGASLGGLTKYTFTTPVGTTFISFRIWGSNQGISAADNVMLELGNSATSYESYSIKVTQIGGVPIKNTDKEVYSKSEVDAKTQQIFSSKNIFNKDNLNVFKVGQGVGDDGNIFSSSSFGCCLHLPVEPNTQYVISGCPSLRGLRFEDSVENLISKIGIISNGTPFTTPSNCSKISFQIYAFGEANANTVQVEKGSVITNYQAYQEKVVSIGGKVIKNADLDLYSKSETESKVNEIINSKIGTKIVLGKNIFNKSNPNIFKIGQGVGDDGNIFSSGSFGSCLHLSVEPNTQYVISGCPALRGLRFEDSGGILISKIGIISNGTPFTTPSNCSKISFQIYRFGEANANTVQVEKGNISTAYESYQEKTFVSKINDIDLMSSSNESSGKALIDYEVITPSDIYFVDSGVTNGREETVSLYLQRFIRDKYPLFLNNSLDRLLLSNNYNSSSDVQIDQINYTIGGEGHISKSLTTNRVSIKRQVLENKFPKVLYIGDSITADRTKNGIYTGGGSLWSYCKELAIKNRIDNNNNGYDYLCVGTENGVNSPFTYRGQTQNVRGFATGFGGWATHSFLRHPFRFWVSSPAGAFDLLGLRTVLGRVYNGSISDKVLIMKTCYGSNTPNITSDSYSLLVAENQIANLGSWSGSQAQVDAINNWIVGIANGTITPQNPFFDYAKTGSNRFSISKYLERYRTLSDDGVTRLVAGSSAGTKITDVNSIDVCTPSHIVLATGENDRIFCNNYIEIVNDLIELANEIRNQLPNSNVGIASTQMPHPMFAERYPNYIGKFRLDQHAQKFDFYKELVSRFGSLSSQGNDKVFIVPTWHTMTPASGSIVTEQIDDSDPDNIIYVSVDDYNHPGYYANRTGGTQIYGWIGYTYTL